MAWLPAETTVEPTAEPITLAQAKSWVRMDGAESDDDLEMLIQAARGKVEADMGMFIVERTVLCKASSFSDLSALPAAPVQSITSIKYLDTNAVEQTLATSVYEAVLPNKSPFVRLKSGQSWPATFTARDAVRVTMVVGYEAPPAEALLAMRLHIAVPFDDRTDATSGAARALLFNHSIHGF